MDDVGSGHDFDTGIELAWEDWHRHVVEAVQQRGPGRCILTRGAAYRQDAEADGHPWLEFTSRRDGWVRFAVAGNRDLTVPMTRRQMAVLRGYGFHRDDRTSRYRVQFLRPPTEAVVMGAVLYFRDVWDVPHPSFLAPVQWEQLAPHPQRASPLPPDAKH